MRDKNTRTSGPLRPAIRGPRSCGSGRRRPAMPGAPSTRRLGPDEAQNHGPDSADAHSLAAGSFMALRGSEREPRVSAPTQPKSLVRKKDHCHVASPPSGAEGGRAIREGGAAADGAGKETPPRRHAKWHLDHASVPAFSGREFELLGVEGVTRCERWRWLTPKAAPTYTFTCGSFVSSRVRIPKRPEASVTSRLSRLAEPPTGRDTDSET